jgi:hypothetical protein
MTRLVAAVALVATLLAACGDDDPAPGGPTPAAGTPNGTATAEATRGPKQEDGRKSAARTKFCKKNSEALTDLSRDIVKAGRDGDPDELGRLTDETLALVRTAPAGAACAVVPLRTLIQIQRTAGDATTAKQLTRFARKRGLTKARF